MEARLGPCLSDNEFVVKGYNNLGEQLAPFWYVDPRSPQSLNYVVLH